MDRYATDTAFERISGEPYGEPPKSWILERGHELEPEARMAYEARTGKRPHLMVLLERLQVIELLIRKRMTLSAD